MTKVNNCLLIKRNPLGFVLILLMGFALVVMFNHIINVTLLIVICLPVKWSYLIYDLIKKRYLKNTSNTSGTRKQNIPTSSKAFNLFLKQKQNRNTWLVIKTRQLSICAMILYNTKLVPCHVAIASHNNPPSNFTHLSSPSHLKRAIQTTIRRFTRTYIRLSPRPPQR